MAGSSSMQTTRLVLSIKALSQHTDDDASTNVMGLANRRETDYTVHVSRPPGLYVGETPIFRPFALHHAHLNDFDARFAASVPHSF